MKILLASSEVFPYSKSGGLADMVGALAKFLAHDGHEVALVTPLYRGISEQNPSIVPADWKLEIPLGDQMVPGSLYQREISGGLTYFFIDCPRYFDRANMYQDRGLDYPDNAERFTFFSKVVVQVARQLPWRTEMIHLHDWQSALVAPLIHEERASGAWFQPPPVCLTIHNLAYQGNFHPGKFALTNLPPAYFRPDALEYWGGLNFLKGGLIFSDMLTTVSPRYAREITTEQYGCGLDGVLRARQDRLVGILNGVDYDEWSTTANPYLSHFYNAGDLRGKAANKAEMQKEFGLPIEPNIPLFGTIGRLVDQKGCDIQLGALEEMLASDMQFILLGSGAREFERGYRKLALRFPKKCAVKIGFDTTLSQRVESALDFFLMPSRFEPCGLNQLYSLRYGAIPIVRVTGGLDDTVTDATENPDLANGIKFQEYSVRALAKAIRKALVLYAEPALLQHYRRNGMAKDFSWKRTAQAYENVYRKALELRAAPASVVTA